ncbi:MAG TPA: MFS transporter [Burkholderiales bacterium]|nr:MFS transporter [Burkholderiales bacterium]
MTVVPSASSAEEKLTEGRVTRATLWVGFFTNGVWDMLSVVVPLYAAAVGLSAADIGFIVAARSVLPTALSIHGGILMDYWGTRRVLLWLAVVCVLLPLLYPLAGWFAPLVVLQLALGLASSLGMAAAQTWSLQTSHDTATLARFSLFSRIGTFLGPLMIGAIWDLLGAWAAFASISLWAAGTVAAAAPTPDTARRKAAAAVSAHRARTLAALIPQWSAHKKALALSAIPAVTFVLAVSFFRNAPGAVQSSLYIVYLGQIGFSGTLIGALVSLSELSGVAGSLVAARMERHVRPASLVVVCIAISILAITLTPLIAVSFTLLAVAAAARGTAQGLSQPVMYSILGRAVPPEAHGASVGVRNAVTRLASIITPAVMGVAAEVYGIAASFYIVGVVMLIGVACLAFAARSLQAPG